PRRGRSGGGGVAEPGVGSEQDPFGGSPRRGRSGGGGVAEPGDGSEQDPFGGSPRRGRRRRRNEDGGADERGLDPDADPESVARTVALNRLSVAPQTRAQLDAAMARKGVPEEVRDGVLDRFTDVGLVDDAAYARAWVESRHAGRGLARRALGYELRKRGVEPAVADDAVETLDPEQEEATARALVAARLPSTRRLDPVARTRRLTGLLARKGYPPGLAFRVVREALEADGVDGMDLPDDYFAD
ncbi:regulatory protein RecX, partial [Jiangella rhizosphaerae]|uniref:regulatory protein RecX n=1 Tax=Jiangella rhizosphaerae TaxID=2293569 RepID=UPI0018F5275D